ncbi:MAG: hypothetical protein EZS28_032305, partial [Streblomastix strix]
MLFVLLIAVSAVLCEDFTSPLPTRSTELESAFKDNNTISLAANILSATNGLTSLKSTNDICQWNVGKSALYDNSKQKVQDVLDLSPCDSYQITLVDSEHFESVAINKTEEYPILIN